MSKTDWYFLPLAIVIFVLIGANELGYGVIAFPPLVLLAWWLMTKAFEQEEPK